MVTECPILWMCHNLLKNSTKVRYLDYFSFFTWLNNSADHFFFGPFGLFSLDSFQDLKLSDQRILTFEKNLHNVSCKYLAKLFYHFMLPPTR